jgi:hypothetical protein
MVETSIWNIDLRRIRVVERSSTVDSFILIKEAGAY